MLRTSMIKRAKGANAARVRGVLMVKILNKCTLTITYIDVRPRFSLGFSLLKLK